MRNKSKKRSIVKGKKRISTKKNRKSSRMIKNKQNSKKKTINKINNKQNKHNKQRILRGGQEREVGFNEGNTCSICQENEITGPNTKCLWECTIPDHPNECHRYCDYCLVTWYAANSNPTILATKCPYCRAHAKGNVVDILNNLIIPDSITSLDGLRPDETPEERVERGTEHGVNINKVYTKIASIGAIGVAAAAAANDEEEEAEEVFGMNLVLVVGIAFMMQVGIEIVSGMIRREYGGIDMLLEALQDYHHENMGVAVEMGRSAITVVYALIDYVNMRAMHGGGGQTDGPYYIEITEDMLSSPQFNIFNEFVKKYPGLQKKDILSLIIDTGMKFTEKNKIQLSKIVDDVEKKYERSMKEV